MAIVHPSLLPNKGSAVTIQCTIKVLRHLSVSWTHWVTPSPNTNPSLSTTRWPPAHPPPSHPNILHSTCTSSPLHTSSTTRREKKMHSLSTSKNKDSAWLSLEQYKTRDRKKANHVRKIDIKTAKNSGPADAGSWARREFYQFFSPAECEWRLCYNIQGGDNFYPMHTG